MEGGKISAIMAVKYRGVGRVRILSTATRVMLAGICSLILTVGLSRFAYTPMLPIMRAETWLTDSAGGWLATFNYAGYMAGALIATVLVDPVRKFHLYRTGLVMAVLTTAAMGLTDRLWLWALLRFLGGLCSASAILLGSSLVLTWLIQQNRRPELGIHFSGMGLGIVVSGLAVAVTPAGLDWAGHWQWLGALGILFALPAWFWLPRPPPLAPSAKAAASSRPAISRWLVLMIAMYFCAGYGYVVAATFIIAHVEKLPGLSGWGGAVWVAVGLAASPACLIWDRVARRTGDLHALLLALASQAAATLLPVLSEHPLIAVAGAILYGGTFIGVVSLTLTVIGRRYPDNPARAMAKLTLSYGTAQILAPALSGTMAQLSGGYRGTLGLSVIVMLAGLGLLLLLLRRPE